MMTSNREWIVREHLEIRNDEIINMLDLFQNINTCTIYNFKKPPLHDHDWLIHDQIYTLNSYQSHSCMIILDHIHTTHPNITIITGGTCHIFLSAKDYGVRFCGALSDNDLVNSSDHLYTFFYCSFCDGEVI